MPDIWKLASALVKFLLYLGVLGSIGLVLVRILFVRETRGFESGMPSLGDVMSDDEIWDVLAYIRSTGPNRIRDIQTGRNPEHRQ